MSCLDWLFLQVAVPTVFSNDCDDRKDVVRLVCRTEHRCHPVRHTSRRHLQRDCCFVSWFTTETVVSWSFILPEAATIQSGTLKIALFRAIFGRHVDWYVLAWANFHHQVISKLIQIHEFFVKVSVSWPGNAGLVCTSNTTITVSPQYYKLWRLHRKVESLWLTTFSLW